MLWQRIASAIILIPIIAAAVYFGGVALLLVILVAGLVAGYEYVHMARRDANRPSYLWCLLLVAALIADGHWPDADITRIAATVIPLLALVEQVFHANALGSLNSWALAVAGAFYIGLPLSSFLRLRALDLGIWWLAIALLGTWICDSGAYFVGRRYGRRPFFAAISPKKTWEGAIGGLVSGVVAVSLLAFWLVDLNLLLGAALGVLLVLAATFGDLSESVIKRQIGVKDSSALIPGHGGMLDRIDSLLFVVPTVYLFARLVGTA